ncbi:MAG: hypothetical protein J5702_02915 [Bacteroidales bacterium]|nr:hypothetical protein [Bacteroidales bacterium]
MKRMICTVALVAISIVGLAQDNLFKEGLARGRYAREFYCAKNEKGKGITLEKMRAYSSKNGYLLGGYTTKEVARFGDVAVALDEFYFLPKEEYSKYIYEFGPAKVKYDALKSRGSCVFFYDGKWVTGKNIDWSGDVTDGWLNGSGVAYFVNPDAGEYLYIDGTFVGGWPQGSLVVGRFTPDKSDPTKVSYEKVSYVDVGELSGNISRYTDESGKWGFVSNGEPNVWIRPTYSSVLKDFSNSRAEVVSDGREIIIDTQGNFVDLTAHQKQLDAAQAAKEKAEALKKQQEEKMRELERKQKEMERERLRKEAEARRVKCFKNAQPGDKVYYSQNYRWSEGIWIFSTSGSYSMRVVCFVEQNVNNGERLQIRVGSVESSSSSRYTTPEIDGIKYQKGDVLWIKPLNDSNWHIEGE